MFGIGMNEFLLLVLLALVLIGPKQLPEVARGIGKLLVAFRRATADLRSAVSDEINAHPEYRDLTQLRDEIADDLRGVGNRARNYVEKEFAEEKRIAGAVEQDVHALGGKVREQIDAASREDSGGPPPADAAAAPDSAASAGSPPAGSAPAGVSTAETSAGETSEPPPDRAEFDKAYRQFYRVDEQSAAETRPETTAADSPEDAHLREREQQAAQAREDPKAGLYLLRSGGRGAGGRGGPYTFSPQPPPKPEADTAESQGESAPAAGRAAGGDKA